MLTVGCPQLSASASLIQCDLPIYISKKSHDIIQEKPVFYGFYCHKILVFCHQPYSIRSGNTV